MRTAPSCWWWGQLRHKGQQWTTTSSHLEQDFREGQRLISSNTSFQYHFQGITDARNSLKKHDCAPWNKHVPSMNILNAVQWSYILLIGTVMFICSVWHYLVGHEVTVKLIFSIRYDPFFIFEDKIYNLWDVQGRSYGPSSLSQCVSCPDLLWGECRQVWVGMATMLYPLLHCLLSTVEAGVGATAALLVSRRGLCNTEKKRKH